MIVIAIMIVIIDIARAFLQPGVRERGLFEGHFEEAQPPQYIQGGLGGGQEPPNSPGPRGWARRLKADFPGRFERPTFRSPHEHVKKS